MKVVSFVAVYTVWTVLLVYSICWCFLYLCITRDAGASRHVAVPTIYKTLFYIYIYIYICFIYIYIYICCAFVGLDNKLYKMHGTYIKIPVSALCITSDKVHPIISNVFSWNEEPVPRGVMTHLNFLGGGLFY